MRPASAAMRHSVVGSGCLLTLLKLYSRISTWSSVGPLAVCADMVRERACGRLGELWAGEQRMLVPAGLNSLLADAAADRTFIYAWECTLKQGPEKPAAWAGGNH